MRSPIFFNQETAGTKSRQALDNFSHYAHAKGCILISLNYTTATSFSLHVENTSIYLDSTKFITELSLIVHTYFICCFSSKTQEIEVDSLCDVSKHNLSVM